MLFNFFEKKTEYCQIVLKTLDRGDLKLSLMKGKPIKEALEQLNTHIISKEEHIHKVYVYLYKQKIEANINTPVMNNIILYSY